LNALSNVVAGTPQVETLELSNSTFQKVAARGPEAKRASKFERAGLPALSIQPALQKDNYYVS
jgi:hypothetical protein